MLERLYEIKTVDAHGILTLPDGREFILAENPGNVITMLAMQGFRVIRPTLIDPSGRIDPDLLPEPTTLIVPSHQFTMEVYDLPYPVKCFVPTDEFADPDQSILENFAADGLFFPVDEYAQE